MRQVINKLVYDTDAAQKIAERDYREAGYEGGSNRKLEVLYKTDNGNFFIYHEYPGWLQKWQMGDERRWIHPVDDETVYKTLCKWGLSPTLAGLAEPQRA